MEETTVTKPERNKQKNLYSMNCSGHITTGSHFFYNNVYIHVVKLISLL